MPFYSLSSSGGLVEAATFAALPATGATGTLYVVTATNTLYRWSGSAYVEVSASPAEIVEGANLAAFPATGAAGKIYVALDTGKTYRWGGSAYAEISASDWATLTSKPSTFAPSAHGHAASEITGLAAVATTGAYADVSGKPSTFAPSAHAASHASGGSDAVTLAVSQVSGLQTALDGKAAASHVHAATDITSGTISAARLPSGIWYGFVAYGNSVIDTNLTVSGDFDSEGTITAVELAGNINATYIATGTLDLARLPVTVEKASAVGNSGTSKTLSLSSASVQTVTLNGNCTFTMPTATAGATLTVILSQGGSNTATFTSVKWPGGTAPTITTGAGKIDVLTFVSDGTNWYGVAVQNLA